MELKAAGGIHVMDGYPKPIHTCSNSGATTSITLLRSDRGISAEQALEKLEEWKTNQKELNRAKRNSSRTWFLYVSSRALTREMCATDIRYFLISYVIIKAGAIRVVNMEYAEELQDMLYGDCGHDVKCFVFKKASLIIFLLDWAPCRILQRILDRQKGANKHRQASRADGFGGGVSLPSKHSSVPSLPPQQRGRWREPTGLPGEHLPACRDRF